MISMKRTVLFFALLFGALTASAQQRPPRLIIQIVVSSMRASDIERYSANFSEMGLNRMLGEGTVYTDARYNYQQTTTPVGLATLTTGAMPAMHGVVGDKWVDYTSNKIVNLTDGQRGPGPYNLFAPTLSETLKQNNPESRVVSVAGDASSAVIMGGDTENVYWIDPSRCDWATSSYYSFEVPEWVRRANRESVNTSYIAAGWRTLYNYTRYKNSRSHGITMTGERQKMPETARLRLTNDYDRLRYTPAGNTAILKFAKQAIVQYKLGQDAATDMLNICLDPARYIMEAYGPESVEVEDMYYRMDADIADLVTFAKAQVDDDNIVVLLTSDHGSGPSHDIDAKRQRRFNGRQFAVIVGGFLNVRYGTGNWVTGYEGSALWLNHNLIYERGLSLAEVQDEVASFAMHFEGVSHVLTSTALRNSYFGSGYAEKMQSSFYARRSGDILVSLMPGWLEMRDRCWSSSGSMYGYDTDVPLIFFGKGIAAQRITRAVDMTSVAPTIAALAAIEEPAASEGRPLEEIFQKQNIQ